MKRLLSGLCVAFLCIGLVLPVRVQAAQAADAAANAKDVDYDVTVASYDNELNLRVGPGAEYPLASPTPHHNGDKLHIYKEATAASGNPWGYTMGGPNRDTPGWVALNLTSRGGAAAAAVPAPAASAPAASSQPVSSGSAGTSADYDVMVNSYDNELNLRTGPGVEYPLASSTPHRNGDVLHITKVATAANGNPWGYTMGGPNRDTPGWVALNLTSRTGVSQPAQSGSQTGTGASQLSPSAGGSSAEPAAIPEIEKVPSAEPASSAAAPSSAASAKPAEPAQASSAVSAAASASTVEAPASQVPVQSAEEVEKEGRNYVLTRAVAGVGAVGAALLGLRWMQVRNYRKRYQRKKKS